MTDVVPVHTATQPSAAASATRRRGVLLTLLLTVAITALAWLAIDTRALRAVVSARQTRAKALAADLIGCALHRARPASAADTADAPRDLVERVVAAMREAQIDPACLVSTLAQPGRGSGSDANAPAQRLILENVEIEPLCRFAGALTSTTTGLRISALQVRARPEIGRWNAELALIAGSD